MSPKVNNNNGPSGVAGVAPSPLQLALTTNGVATKNGSTPPGDCVFCQLFKVDPFQVFTLFFVLFFLLMSVYLSSSSCVLFPPDKQSAISSHKHFLNKIYVCSPAGGQAEPASASDVPADPENLTEEGEEAVATETISKEEAAERLMVGQSLIHLLD